MGLRIPLSTRTLRRLRVLPLAGLALLVTAAPALACGGLVAPNGSVNLVRTSTLAAYHNGIEHYVTSFEFAGGGAKFGSIVPLPGVPRRVTRGGEWTLQRLAQEVQPPVALADADGAAKSRTANLAKVLLEKQIDGLKITILEGGGFAVGRWAERNGFRLSPDAPEVLDFYADRSPIFMAARFNPKARATQKLVVGDGIPIHLRIPTDNPWVPLRILGLGKQASERVEADVFLLTDREPALLPGGRAFGPRGLILERNEPASDSLMFDLRSDKGMSWMPEDGMWLSYLRIDSDARDLTYDLAIDVSGLGRPSPVDAGFVRPPRIPGGDSPGGTTWWSWVTLPILGVGTLALSSRLLAHRN